MKTAIASVSRWHRGVRSAGLFKDKCVDGIVSTKKKKGSEVMKKLWLLLALAVPLQSIHSQEVKPTVEQCRADRASWFSKISDDAKAEEAEGLRAPVAHSTVSNS